MNKIKIFRFILVVIAVCNLSACSAYKSKFRCGEASGLSCTMLSEIDRQISSGEIEEVEKHTKCKGRNCKDKFDSNKQLPKLKRDRHLKILLMDDSTDEEDEIIEEVVIDADSKIDNIGD